MAVLVDAAAQCMLDIPAHDNTQYLTTKSFLVSAQWKFAHKFGNPEALDNVPIVVVRESPYQVHLPGIFLFIKNAHHWNKISLMMYRYSSLFGRSTSALYCGILHQLLSIPFQSIPARINFKEVDYSTLGIEYNLYGYSELVIACFFRKCVSLCQEVEFTLAWRYRSISIGVLCMFSRKHFKSLLNLIADDTFM